MGPKKDSDKGEAKRKTVRTTIELKKVIIAKYESGVRVSDLASQYEMAKSTISTILKHKEVLKKADVAIGVTAISKQRPQIMEEMEKLLLIFTKEEMLAGDSISEALICKKALQIYEDLLKTTVGESASSFTFKASRGWFEKFKHRTGIHRVTRHGEAASSDKAAAEKYVTEFSETIKAEEYVPEQVFNCDKTGLFWKKLPANTYITKEETKMPGHKPMKEQESSEDEDVREEASGAVINDMCAKWGELQEFVEKYHPDTAASNRAVIIFNDTVMAHFQKIVQKRQKQLTVDRFLLKEKRKATAQPDSPPRKRERRLALDDCTEADKLSSDQNLGPHSSVCSSVLQNSAAWENRTVEATKPEPTDVQPECEDTEFPSIVWKPVKCPQKSQASRKRPNRPEKVLTLEEKAAALDMLRVKRSYPAVSRHYKVKESTIRQLKRMEAEIRKALATSPCTTTAKVASTTRSTIAAKIASTSNRITAKAASTSTSTTAKVASTTSSSTTKVVSTTSSSTTKVVSGRQDTVLARVESALVRWILSYNKKNIHIKGVMIQEKARQLYKEFSYESKATPVPGDDAGEIKIKKEGEEEEARTRPSSARKGFVASSGWLCRFQKRFPQTSVHVQRKKMEKYTETFKRIFLENNYRRSRNRISTRNRKADVLQFTAGPKMLYSRLDLCDQEPLTFTSPLTSERSLAGSIETETMLVMKEALDPDPADAPLAEALFEWDGLPPMLLNESGLTVGIAHDIKKEECGDAESSSAGDPIEGTARAGHSVCHYEASGPSGEMTGSADAGETHFKAVVHSNACDDNPKDVQCSKENDQRLNTHPLYPFLYRRSVVLPQPPFGTQ